MKSNERKHLKENDFARRLLAVQEFIEPRKQVIGIGVLALVVIGIGVGGYALWQGRTDDRGQDLLAAALVTYNARVVPTGTTAGEENVPAAAQFGAQGTYPTEDAKLKAAVPKLKTAAEAFPDSQAGVEARYLLASAYASLGQYEDAIREFGDVATRAGENTLYGQMALLGKADSQARANQLDAAITTWKSLAARTDTALPVDAILIELGKAYVQMGNTDEARRTLTELVDQHPNSPYSAEAREQLESLKS